MILPPPIDYESIVDRVSFNRSKTHRRNQNQSIHLLLQSIIVLLLLGFRLNKVCNKVTYRFLLIRVHPVVTDELRRRATGYNRLETEFKGILGYIQLLAIQSGQRAFDVIPRYSNILVLLG